MSDKKQNIIVAITGASGAIYGKLLLDKLITINQQWNEISVVFSNNGRAIWNHELNHADIAAYPYIFRANNDFSSPFASGSSDYQTMIIIPASMGIVGRIANGISDDLITRSADVMLKERRRLIVVPRETPYSLIHLRNMTLITEAGGIICPANPSFYAQPQTIEQVALSVVERVLALAGLDIDGYKWGGEM